MYSELLKKVKNQRDLFGKGMQIAADDTEINTLTDLAKSELNVELPEQYLDFLRINNGLILNGLFIYSTKKVSAVGSPNAYNYGFVEMNLIARDVEEKKDFIIFGEDNMDEYVYEISTQEYQSRDRVPFELVDTFPSFEAMMSFAIEKNL
jgi:hypothetical protein